MKTMSKKRVVVIGAGETEIKILVWLYYYINGLLTGYAGVSGLSTAILILQQESEFNVHLVAKHFPGDLSGEYTSPWYVANVSTNIKR